MERAERDNDQLGIILNYCERLELSVQMFGDNYETFAENVVYQDSCSLCLIQIGGAVNRLSEKFRESQPQIEWRKIYGMRCHLVHGYEMFDAEIAWDAIQNQVPVLHAFCSERFQAE